MLLITERSCILDVSNRWDAQYPPNLCTKDKKEIGDKLRSLNLETATADDIEKIIGNRSWTIPDTCNECGAKDSPVVQLGQEPDYESRTAWICKKCLSKAIKLFDGR